MDDEKKGRQVVSISMPQSLRKRMQAVGYVNWSRICRFAIEERLKFEEARTASFAACGITAEKAIKLTPDNIHQVAKAVGQLAEAIERQNHDQAFSLCFSWFGFFTGDCDDENFFSTDWRIGVVDETGRCAG